MSVTDLPEPEQQLPHELARKLLQAAHDAGEPEPTASELEQKTGLSRYNAYLVKQNFRGGKRGYGGRRPSRGQYLPRDQSWSAITDELEANPGKEYSLAALARATGIPARTIARLWQEKLGVSYGEPPDQQPRQRPELKELAYPMGTVLTVCGQHGDDLLADCDGKLVKLTVTPLEI